MKLPKKSNGEVEITMIGPNKVQIKVKAFMMTGYAIISESEVVYSGNDLITN